MISSLRCRRQGRGCCRKRSCDPLVDDVDAVRIEEADGDKEGPAGEAAGAWGKVLVDSGGGLIPT